MRFDSQISWTCAQLSCHRRGTILTTAAAAVLPQERYARQEVARTLRRVFQSIDTKSDGKIDEQELGAYLSLMRYKPKKVGKSGAPREQLPGR